MEASGLTVRHARVVLRCWGGLLSPEHRGLVQANGAGLDVDMEQDDLRAENAGADPQVIGKVLECVEEDGVQVPVAAPECVIILVRGVVFIRQVFAV